MRNQQDAVVRVARRDLEDGADDSLAQLLVRLAVVPALAAFSPATKGVGKELLSFGPGQAGPRAHVDLAQVGELSHGKPMGSATIAAVSRARSRSLE